MNSTDSSSMAQRRPGFAFGAQLALGVWLLVSPFLLGYEVGASMWSTVLCGAGLLLLALLRAAMPARPGFKFAALLIGTWLILAPFLFDYLSMRMFWNSIIAGALAIVFTAASRGTWPATRAR